ncbi:MAG TPA: magnesium chelatase, partial [Candidatus Paceibacterota bacterium]|nr:magnesium chelatase [Candidatus Paceibacterota bacterium]
QVLRARAMQQKRFGKDGKLNSELSPRELDDLVPLSPKVRATLEAAGARLSLSPRAFHRVIKVARTIADLEGSEELTESHALEALQYRERKQ